MPYACKYQVRSSRFTFLTCSKMNANIENVLKASDAAKAYCLYQHHCSCSNRAENTDSAKNCKLLNQPLKKV